MKKTSLLLAVILVTAIACKKSTTTTTGGPVGTTQSATITNGFGTAGTSNINGVFFAELLNFPSLNSIQYDSRASLVKTARPFSQSYLVDGLVIPGDSAGHLKLNTTAMVRDTGDSPFVYTDTTSAPNYSSGVKWTLAGNANFTAFSTTVTRGFPVVANANYIPATLSKSQNFILNLSTAGYTNTDSLTVMIYTGSSTTSTAAFKYVAGNASSVTFTPADMSSLITNGAFNEIVVYAKNFSSMSVNSKNYVFIMQYTIGAFVTITP